MGAKLDRGDRRQWADYFDSQGVQYAFFSAANATALQQARRDALTAEEARVEAEENQMQYEGKEEEDVENVAVPTPSSAASPPPESDDDESEEEDTESEDESAEFSYAEEEDSEDARDPRARVLSVLELEDLFVKMAPDLSSEYLSNITHRRPCLLMEYRLRRCIRPATQQTCCRACRLP